MRSNLVAALILIVVGLLFLANNLGWSHLSIGKLLTTWWPAILVAVGIGMLFSKGK
jgi:cytochrome c biogenesis protein CcdA